MNFKKLFMPLVLVILLVTTNSHASETNELTQLNQIYSNLVLNGQKIIVVGHKNPDSDTVCSAIAFANLLNKLGYDAEARVSGKINNETKFILKSLEIEVPSILENANNKTVALVDHSSFSQAVNGMEQANIIGIIDHHALGNIVTSAPLVIKFLPVGATATIIYYEYLQAGVELDVNTAGLLLSALLSDTIHLTSSTTTHIDKAVATKLIKLSKVKDDNVYFNEMSKAAASYDGLSDEEIFNSDYKEFVMGNKKIGITQVNMLAATRDDLTNRMNGAMGDLFAKKGVDMLFVRARDRESARMDIAYYGEGAKEACSASFESVDGNRFFINLIASRKKDVVPKLMKVINISNVN